MKCPFCSHVADKVVDSRESKEGEAIRRRRQCLNCERRFTSYERIDRIDYRVVKKDGNRERFDREKLMNGILKACEKRAIPLTRVESIVDQVEHRLHGLVRVRCTWRSGLGPSRPGTCLDSVSSY